jgi:signal transduction histidine kinase
MLVLAHSQPDYYSPQSRELSQAFANQVAIAIHNAQLYEQASAIAALEERNRLARELHDSVTQTVFSMNLTSQSALLLYERDLSQVEGQLNRLNQLAQSALSEMQILISELRPEKSTQSDIVSALRKHIADRTLQENLSIIFEVEGDGVLNTFEEQGLFRIAQEAINNIVKHARTENAQITLHLSEPYWMEITDHGQGFDLGKALEKGRVGLCSMQERAEEIGWKIEIISSPGSATRIHVESPS